MARKLVVAAVAFVIVAALSSVAQAAPPAFDIRGTWSYTSHTGGNDYHGVLTYKTLDCTSGAMTGTGAGGIYTFPITGTLDGTKLTTKDGPYDQLPSYTSYSTGTVADVNHISGKFADSYGRVLDDTAWEAVRTAGPPAGGCATVVPTPTPDPSGLLPSAVQVQCNYLVATSTDTCTATVADAGPQPTTAVTGSVTFSAKQGVFSAGTTCTLTQTSFSPGISSCSVQYIPASVAGAFPDVTATYGGDAAHGGAAGSTIYHVLGGPVQYETPKAFTIKVTDYVPVDGTQVTACALVATSGKASPRVKTAQAEDAADELRKIRQKIETATPADQQVLATDQRAALATARETLRQLREADVTDRKHVAELLKQINDVTFGIQKDKQCTRKATGKLGELLSASTSAAKQRSHSASVGIVKRKSAKAGPLDLALKLDAKVLKKIAHSKKRLKLYIRVNMILPSDVYKNGWPQASVRRVTLTNAGKLVG